MKNKDRVGEKHFSKNYGNCEIIEYKSCTNCTVQFEDGTIVRNIQYVVIKEGKVRNPNFPIVFGVGYMGQGKYEFKLHYHIYKKWQRVLGRCYDEKYHLKRPTYIECSTIKEWHNFQVFAEWHEKNFKFHMDGWHLDKDILVKGNKIYSPETCCFIPSTINSLFTKRQKCRGNLPIGVQKAGNRFISCFNRNNIITYLGTFDTIEEAFQAYKTAKESYIKETADLWKHSIDPKTYQALINYKVEITD